MLGALLAGSRDGAGWFGLKLTSVSGTNTVVGTVAAQGSITMAPTAYATGQRFHFIPAATNTGATTLNVSSLGAKNVFYAGRACIGGELKINQPVVAEYDGTQFQVLGSSDLNVFTEDTTPDFAADFVQTYDASASGYKKVKLGTSAGAEITLGSTTVSTVVATVDITSANFPTAFDGTYNQIIFDIVRLVPATDATEFRVRFSQDGGGTFKAGVSDYRVAIKSGSDATAAGDAALGAQDHIRLNSNVGGFTLDNAAEDGWSGRLMLIDPSATTNHKHLYFEGSYLDNEPATAFVSGCGRYVTDTNAVNGVRFIMSSGNIASCIIYVRAKRKT